VYWSSVLATNDLVAMGVIEALSLAGIQVPERIGVIGYDDLGREMDPPLTTIRSFPEEVGRLAAQVLIDHLRGKPTQSRMAVQAELVVRGTTAAHRSEL
jgi:LacI family transcriptional regulator